MMTLFGGQKSADGSRQQLMMDNAQLHQRHLQQHQDQQQQQLPDVAVLRSDNSFATTDTFITEDEDSLVLSSAAAATADSQNSSAAAAAAKKRRRKERRRLSSPTIAFRRCNRLLGICFLLALFTVILAAFFMTARGGGSGGGGGERGKGGYRSGIKNYRRKNGNLYTEGRCFSMCEPDNILLSEDRLMKPYIAHNGIKPTRYFLYLYPEEPEFGPEVGEPAYLTQYIRSGDLDGARDRARVTGLQWPELESYAGFLTISDQLGSHLYFWFFPSQSRPESDPLILWLQGGPGATSLFGLFKENGPIRAFVDRETKKPSAELNKFSWNRNASMLFVDNPVGAGFSYTSNHSSGYPNFVNQSSEDLFVALQQFYTIWHDYRDRDLYVFGESYGGKYIPALSHRIHLSKTDKPRFGGPVDINLRGIGIGNGWMSPIDQGKYASYLFYHGLLDGEQYMTLLELEDSLIEQIHHEQWFDSWMASDNQLHFILQSLNYSSLYDLTQGQYNPDSMDFWYFLQDPLVRRAMNLGNRSMSDGLDVYKAMIEDTMQDVRAELAEAMDNYKVLIYHGALDIICHFPGAQEMLARLNWTSKDAFHRAERRAVWFEDETSGERLLSGYVKGDADFKLMLLRNAGHSAPADQPQTAMRMVQAFIDGTL